MLKQTPETRVKGTIEPNTEEYRRVKSSPPPAATFPRAGPTNDVITLTQDAILSERPPPPGPGLLRPQASAVIVVMHHSGLSDTTRIVIVGYALTPPPHLPLPLPTLHSLTKRVQFPPLSTSVYPASRCCCKDGARLRLCGCVQPHQSLWATGSVLTVGRIVHAAPEIEIACRAEVLDSAGGRRAGGSIEVEEDTAGLHTRCACQHAAAADITLRPHPRASNPPLRTPTSAPSFPLSIEEKGHAAPRELWKTWASPR
ncbi:hypothetical protein C8R44DRAFT_870646 [Mycena epipterygia]|nr:hypothetical protein C8R44DRAFT_870646 [Mycena epipterygia]